VSQPDKVFVWVAQALEAETIQGQTAVRVVNSTKNLLLASNLNPAPLLAQFSQDAQRTITGFFA
jgi:hypothetical protein